MSPEAVKPRSPWERVRSLFRSKKKDAVEDPLHDEASRAIDEVLSSESVREALDADQREGLEDLVRIEAMKRLLKSAAFAAKVNSILASREATAERSRPLLEAAGTQRERVNFAVRLLAVTGWVAVTLGTFSQVDSGVLIAVLGAGFAGLAGLFYWQIRRASRVEQEARRLQAVAEDEEKAVWESLVLKIVAPKVFSIINRLKGTVFSTRLEPFATKGLWDLFDPEFEVPVSATKRLGKDLSNLRAGSLGIAGSRGAGKTTLIRAACEGRLNPSDDDDDDGNATPAKDDESGPDALGVMVSAPVRYEAQEFIPYVFGELCLKVRGADSDLDRYTDALAERRRALTAVGGTFGLLVSSYALVFATGNGSPLGSWAAGFIGIGALAVLAPGLALLRDSRGKDSSERFKDDPIRAEADRHLEQLRYLETRSREWSGEIAAKPAKLGHTRGRSLASQPLTLPELTSLYRQFVGKVTAERPLIVGIDELDKMATPQDVRSFLNDIKSLFGQPKTYYLISMSEQAMSAFARRGLPLRDVFDSVFDDVLYVDFLNLAESESLLSRRVIGMAPPFTALCHCIAGGLPRELIRCARKVVQSAKDDSQLSAVASDVTRQRIKIQERAVGIAVSQMVDRDARQPVVHWLDGLPDLDQKANGEVLAEALLERCAIQSLLTELDTDFQNSSTAGERATESVKPRLAVIQLAASWYLAATLLEFFSGIEEDEASETRTWTAAEDEALVKLCLAQQQLAISVELAWKTAGEVRTSPGALPFPGEKPVAETEPPGPDEPNVAVVS